MAAELERVQGITGQRQTDRDSSEFFQLRETHRWLNLDAACNESVGMQLFSPDTDRKMGLVAGWGDFPLAVARSLKRQGFRVYCLGIRGHADPALATLCDDYREIGIAKLGGQIRFLKRRGVHQATMAGKIFKAKLMFHKLGWVHHLPDWTCCRTFYPHFLTRTSDRKDDTLLKAVVDCYARGGIVFAPATDFAPELLVKLGPLAGRKPTSTQMKDIEFGWQMAKELGRLDIGQTVAVKGRAALAVEAVEGTDQCIRRAGQLCAQGGFTVVKVAKPQQDMRFDVPTIGVGTLQTMVESGGRILAIEAEKTIIVDQPAVTEFAERHRLTLIAVQVSNGKLRVSGESNQTRALPVENENQLPSSPHARRDAG